MAPKGLLLAALAIAGSTLELPFTSAANIQIPSLSVPSAYAEDLQVVRDIFNTSYSAYRQYAWGHDDLSPLSKVGKVTVRSKLKKGFTNATCRITRILGMGGEHPLLMQ
jgi:hypothetical protein